MQDSAPPRIQSLGPVSFMDPTFFDTGGDSTLLHLGNLVPIYIYTFF